MNRRCKVVLVLVPALYGCALRAQTEIGELRLTVVDQAGAPVPASIAMESQANQYKRTFIADTSGRANAKRLAFGPYDVQVTQPGFAPYSARVEIRSAVSKEMRIALALAGHTETVTVTERNDTLVDLDNTGAVNRIGSASIQDRTGSAPGRSIANLVNTEPGWLQEANGVLHPRGSEYQTQYVVDGIPLTDNRSAAFAPDFDADDVQSMSVMTAGFPAEYGRKMGGVIELTTARDTRRGFHGKAVGYGGSFETAGGYLEGLYGWAANTLTVSFDGSSTGRYLDPPVTENFTNHGTTGDAMVHYERDLTDRDRIGVIFRREQAKFEVPDERLQEEAGQRQDRGSFETSGQVSYTHIFSPNVLGDVRGMDREVAADLRSNPLSTPIIAAQNRTYQEGYVKGSLSIHSGLNEIKVGAEGDFASIHEALKYAISDATQFDAGTPATFDFRGSTQDREQGYFAQDALHWKNLALSAGLRYDHYGLVVRQGAWSPRAGVAYAVPKADLVFRFSYDKIFQTPAFENILVSSSAAVTALGAQVLRVPVQPSRGDYFEAGFSKGFFSKFKLNTNFYHRDVRNFADDDLLLNTGVSFPVAFARAAIYGVEVKAEVPRWGPFSGYANWSHMRGNGYLPVTGGLFLGNDAVSALSATTGIFPVSQDQRNTIQSRFRVDVTPRLWMAAGMSYGSGLPVQFNGDYQLAVMEYSQRIVDRVDFLNGRLRPSYSIDISVGAILQQREKRKLRLQADALNVTGRLNVIDFAGLFSGTAIAAPRTVSLRAQFEW